MSSDNRSFDYNKCMKIVEGNTTEYLRFLYSEARQKERNSIEAGHPHKKLLYGFIAAAAWDELCRRADHATQEEFDKAYGELLSEANHWVGKILKREKDENEGC